MSKPCSICSSPDRLKIDKALISGQTVPSLARQFNVSEQPLRRHKANCLSRQLITAAKKKDLLHSEGLLNILESLLVTSNLVIAEAYAKEKLQIALNGIGQSRGVVETVARIVFDLKELELKEQEIDKPLNINVTLKDDLPDFQYKDKDDQPKQYTRNKGIPKGVPKEIPILDDDIDYDMEPEIEDEPELITYPGTDDAFWEREKRKARRRQGLVNPKAKRRRPRGGPYSDRVVPGSVRTSRDIGL